MPWEAYQVLNKQMLKLFLKKLAFILATSINTAFSLGIWPAKKLSNKVLAWISVWSEVQITDEVIYEVR